MRGRISDAVAIEAPHECEVVARYVRELAKPLRPDALDECVPALARMSDFTLDLLRSPSGFLLSSARRHARRVYGID